MASGDRLLETFSPDIFGCGFGRVGRPLALESDAFLPEPLKLRRDHHRRVPGHEAEILNVVHLFMVYFGEPCIGGRKHHRSAAVICLLRQALGQAREAIGVIEDNRKPSPNFPVQPINLDCRCGAALPTRGIDMVTVLGS